MEGNGRGGRKGKGEGRGEVEGGIWPPKNFGVAPPMSGHKQDEERRYVCYNTKWLYYRWSTILAELPVSS